MSFLATWLAATPELATPYALAALGLLLSERAGVLNLTAEGVMLAGACAAVGASIESGVPGLLAAALAGALVGVLFAGLVVALRVNQVIAGLAVVFLCQGASSLAGTLFGWQNRPVSGFALVGGQPWPVLAVLPLWWAADRFLYRSMPGLRLRAVGENPEAADAAGVGIIATRFAAVVGGSALVGMAGGFLALGGVRMWIAGMTGGRGWIAVALVIFARWQPWRALAGALLFGAIEALIPRVAAAGLRVPQTLLLMSPYLVTLGVMAWGARRGAWFAAPAALGRPHLREERL